MDLQICLLLTTLVVCGADIRPAGWLDKVVAHWKKSFVDEFEQLAPFNLDASIEPAPPGYQDSPDWDFDSVSRMLALLSVSETGQPTLNSLRRMIAPTRRMMMDVPGLAGSHIPESLYNNRRGKHRSGMNDRRGRRNQRKRTVYNRMNPNNRMGMAGNRMGMANNRMDMAYNRKGMPNNRMGMAYNRKGMPNNRMGMAYDRMEMQSKTGRKQIMKRKKERQLSDFQMSFRWYPSIKDQIPQNIYYDEELDDYKDASPEYEYVDLLAGNKKKDAIVLLKNPVEARLPSARISIKLLKEILEARAKAARVMPTKKTTRFSWKPTDMTTPLTNENSDDISTTAEGAATAAADDGLTTDGSGDGATNPGGGGEVTTVAGDAPAADDDAPATDGDAPAEDLPMEGRKMAAKTSKVAAIHKKSSS